MMASAAQSTMYVPQLVALVAGMPPVPAHQILNAMITTSAQLIHALTEIVFILQSMEFHVVMEIGMLRRSDSLT